MSAGISCLRGFHVCEDLVEETRTGVTPRVPNRDLVGIVAKPRPRGFEPLTIRLEGGCSIQLSYGRSWSQMVIILPVR